MERVHLLDSFYILHNFLLSINSRQLKIIDKYF